MATQTVAQHDLILISDSGKFYLVKMTPSSDGVTHEPTSVAPLDQTFQAVPAKLRDQGVELADLPDDVEQGGASCFLLNLQRLAGAAPTPPRSKKKKKTAKTAAKKPRKKTA